MALKSPWWRRVFALLVIAHGLAHAVLPLRGSLQPGMLPSWDSRPPASAYSA
jgi:hypothetical protein